jgi:DNA mismatch repair ATPase MutL
VEVEEIPEPDPTSAESDTTQAADAPELTPEEAKRKAEELQQWAAEKRRQREEQEEMEAKAREIKRREEAKTSATMREEFEAEREKKAIAAAKRERDEDRAYRAKVQAQIKADKERRRLQVCANCHQCTLMYCRCSLLLSNVVLIMVVQAQGQSEPAPAPAPAPVAAAAHPVSQTQYTDCVLQIRNLDGSNKALTFEPTDTIQMVYQQLGLPSNLALMTTFPRKLYVSAADLQMTLQAAGM